MNETWVWLKIMSNRLPSRMVFSQKCSCSGFIGTLCLSLTHIARAMLGHNGTVHTQPLGHSRGITNSQGTFCFLTSLTNCPIFFPRVSKSDHKRWYVWDVALDIPNLLGNSDPRFPVAVSNIIVFEHIGPGETIHLLNLLPTASLGFGNLEQIISFFFIIVIPYIPKKNWDCALPLPWKPVTLSLRSRSIRPLCGAFRAGPIEWFRKKKSQNSQCPAGDVRFLTCVHV